MTGEALTFHSRGRSLGMTETDERAVLGVTDRMERGEGYLIRNSYGDIDGVERSARR